MQDSRILDKIDTDEKAPAAQHGCRIFQELQRFGRIEIADRRPREKPDATPGLDGKGKVLVKSAMIGCTAKSA